VRCGAVRCGVQGVRNDLAMDCEALPDLELARLFKAVSDSRTTHYEQSPSTPADHQSVGPVGVL
jgi:hypothetical protein